MNTEAGAVLLEAATTSIGVGAQQGVSDPTRLRNPLDGPMLIDEVRFNLDPGDASAFPQDRAIDVQVQLKLGRTILTKGFVPLWTICPGVNADIPSIANQRDSALLTWKFPRPLFVPKGEYLEPIFYNTGAFLSVARTLRVAYAGRALAQGTKPPAQVPVPYAAAFVGTLKATAADTTEQSRETDLVNPFKVPLRVQRFIGRLGCADASGQAEYGLVQAIDAAFQYCLVQMVDSKDRIVVRDRTPFGHLFSVKDRTWNVNAVLEPRGFYLAYFTENYSTLTGNGIQVFLGMVGWRPVPAAQLGKE